jgi:phosphoenolpyruvate carboxykinase (ATP)
MPIRDTRALVRAVLDGSLAAVPTIVEPHFGLHIPVSCPDVDARLLNPVNTWESSAAYEEQAQKVAGMFVDNFAVFAESVDESVIAAGPALEPVR